MAFPTAGDFLNHVPFALFLFLWYAVDVTISLINYVVWVQFEEGLVGSTYKNVYLSFVILGMIAFLIPSAVFFFLSCMRSASPKDTRNKLIVALVFVYLFSDFPLFILEFIAQWEYGFHSLIQSLSFLITTVSWVAGSILVWGTYMWKISKYLEYRGWGGAGKTGFRGGAPSYALAPVAMGTGVGTPRRGLEQSIA